MAIKSHYQPIQICFWPDVIDKDIQSSNNGLDNIWDCYCDCWAYFFNAFKLYILF